MPTSPKPRNVLQRLLGALLLLAANPVAAPAEPSPAASLAFNAYAQAVEHRLALQHAARTSFLAPADLPRLRQGDLLLQQIQEPGVPKSDIPGAMLHHWRGSAFVPGAYAPDFERLLRDLPSYPKHFAPDVLQASLLTAHGDQLQTSMRVRQHHGLTVVLDTSYIITFGRLDPRHAWSLSRSSRIAEIASPNTPAEHPLTPADEHGFLWRLNTYWTWQECDNGLYLQIETVSLSRAIPQGLGWALRPYVESIPRDSLRFTLQAARSALQH